jgi:hypothetical protein
MTEQDNRTAAEQIVQRIAGGDFNGAAALFHEDAMVDWPQSGERVVGRENIMAVLRDYPGGTPAATLRAVRAAGDLAVVETEVTYPDGSRWYTAEILEFRDGMVAHETDYFGQGFDAPEWRAKWVESVSKERS